MIKMRHASLFSGIGGFDLAAEWMEWENVLHCEFNDFGRRILKYYWPKAKSYEDITKTDFNIYRGRIDILTGGFPCQPYSTAGKRLGKEDDRHLWPEMLRAIREIKPTYVVAENVSGLISWNDGLVFNEVQTDLENEGYKVQPCVLSAAGLNAPHRRDRVWFVAYTESKPSKCMQSEQREISQPKQREFRRSCSKVESNGTLADTERKRQQEQRKQERQMRFESFRKRKASWTYHDGRWPTQSPICSRDDGFSNQLDGITLSNWRQESIKGYGNAIVPQVAYQIFKALKLTNNPTIKKINP